MTDKTQTQIDFEKICEVLEIQHSILTASFTFNNPEAYAVVIAGDNLLLPRAIDLLTASVEEEVEKAMTKLEENGSFQAHLEAMGLLTRLTPVISMLETLKKKVELLLSAKDSDESVIDLSTRALLAMRKELEEKLLTEEQADKA